MADAEPAPAGRPRLLALAGGALLGAGAALGGALVWQRKRRGEPTPDAATGRGLPDTPPSPEAERQGFETEDMSARTMGWLAVGLAVAVACTIALMIGMLQLFQNDRRAAPPLTAQQQATGLPPQPRLQTAPWDDIAGLRRSEMERLDRYGWVDPAHLRARVPIALAMHRTVGQSLDAAP